MTRLPGLGAALVLALALGAAGCSDDAEPVATPDAGATDVPNAAPASELAVPEGVTVTEPGSVLRHGDRATVAWQPSDDTVAVLDLEVSSVRETTRRAFRGWLQDDRMKASRPYFVDVVAKNRGEVDLGGTAVPLFLLDDAGTYGTPWTFGGDFTRCQSGPLPEPFAPGDKARMCLVYLAPDHGRIDAMAFTGEAGADPITWTGKVARPRAERPRKGSSRRR